MPSSHNFQSEMSAAGEVRTEDSSNSTRTASRAINHDLPRILPDEDDQAMFPNPAAIPIGGGSGRPRPGLKVYTTSNPNIPQGITVTRLLPEGKSDGSRDERSIDLNKSSLPKSPLHRRVITFLTYSTPFNDEYLVTDTLERGDRYHQRCQTRQSQPPCLGTNSKHTD